MENPWKSISLSDYENHMKLDSVMQLQALNEIMRLQLHAYPVNTAMVLGVAGGNGLEHIDRNKYTAVYGIDVNPAYLQTVQERNASLAGILHCICLDLTKDFKALPAAELVIANLLIEYIGYECFQNVIRQVKPAYISCGIQINRKDGFVSESPYTHSFDGLADIHCQIEPEQLEQCMNAVGYHSISSLAFPLPNGKQLVRLDFSC